ncbi:MAG: calcium-binding protein, partial [Pseudomonadales bacterium]
MPWTTDEYGLENLERDIALFSRWQMAFDEFALRANLPERDLATYITEWNTRNLAMNNGMVEGLQGATGTLAAFYYLVSSGVDVMHVWPLLQTSTSALLRTSDLDLSVNYNGAAFAILKANTVGLRAHLGDMHYDIDSDGQNDILVQLFTSDDRAMVIVASISDDHLAFDLSLPSAFFEFHAADWSSFSLVSSTSNPTDILSQPRIDTTSDTVDRHVGSEVLAFALPPWSINFSMFELTDGTSVRPATTSDDAAVALAFALYADLSQFERSLLPAGQRDFVHLVATSASDLAEAVPGFVLDAQAGDDTVLGSDFEDTLIGGQGHDQAFAGDGNDLLLFASRDDRDEGGGFVDSIHAGDGDDTISAGGGVSGDYVDAGDGNDIVYFDSAPNLLIGGTGGDRFHFQGGSVYDDALFAVNVSSPWQVGTGEWLPVADMTRNTSFLDGGAGYDVLFLTPGSDAFFLADE